MKNFIIHNRILFQTVMMIIAIGFLFSGCERDHNKRGYQYFPDMGQSVPYETYDSNPNFPDGKTTQSSVEGTISREMQPYSYPKTDEGIIQAGLELKNPYEVNKETIARGKKEYDIYCGICHGTDGRGEGILYKSGKYPSEPASLVSEDMWEKPEGEIFHVITMGSVIMDSHASQIRREDRWKIVLYIKNVLQNKEKERLAKELQQNNNDSVIDGR